VLNSSFDFRENDPRIMRQIFRSYAVYVARHESPARLCHEGVPAWIVHRKGDGGLTDEERHTLEACPHTTVITIPGSSCFISDERPERVADLVVALDRADWHSDAVRRSRPRAPVVRRVVSDRLLPVAQSERIVTYSG
jgi:pimeloyl-ACP methyl ester carboxylesterase